MVERSSVKRERLHTIRPTTVYLLSTESSSPASKSQGSVALMPGPNVVDQGLPEGSRKVHEVPSTTPKSVWPPASHWPAIGTLPLAMPFPNVVLQVLPDENRMVHWLPLTTPKSVSPLPSQSPVMGMSPLAIPPPKVVDHVVPLL